MNITIYGVGRSGTKAVQLYLAHLLSRKEGKVRIIYEPFFWVNRKAGFVNYQGYYHDATLPKFMPDANFDFNRSQRKFLDGFKSNDCSVITKCIRANGRILPLNNYLQPDYSFLIIRDLYEVLESILQQTWDFLSAGFDYNIDWERFVKEATSVLELPEQKWILKNVRTRLDRNAFYWYTMNLASIRFRDKNTLLIPYHTLSSLELQAQKMFGLTPQETPALSEWNYNGNNLHDNFPLMSTEPNYSVINFINSIMYNSRLLMNKGIFLSYSKTGSIASINPVIGSLYREKLPPSKVMIKRNELFDFFNSEIEKKINSEMELKNFG